MQAWGSLCSENVSAHGSHQLTNHSWQRDLKTLTLRDHKNFAIVRGEGQFHYQFWVHNIRRNQRPWKHWVLRVKSSMDTKISRWSSPPGRVKAFYSTRQWWGTGWGNSKDVWTHGSDTGDLVHHVNQTFAPPAQFKIICKGKIIWSKHPSARAFQEKLKGVNSPHTLKSTPNNPLPTGRRIADQR